MLFRSHAEEDKKFHELVTVRNTAEQMIHGLQKSMADMEDDKFEDGEKDAIEAAIKELEEVKDGDDKEAIEAKTAALGEASQKMAERMYAQEGGADAAGAAGAAGDAGAADAKADDDVVDAEFEEVDDKK